MTASLEELKKIGFHKNKNVYWGLVTSNLCEEAIKREEGYLVHMGPLVTTTGKHTGRSADDKFIVRDQGTENKVWWEQNKSFSSDKFQALQKKIISHLENKDIFVQDCFVGADPEHRYPVRVITENAWHNIFVRNMFFRQEPGYVHSHPPKFTIIQAPSFKADPKADGTRSETFIILNFTTGVVLIGGTAYAGEIKKAVFTLLNFVYPDESVFPMHSSINFGKYNDVALFFGLSGTGKTTLSTDPDRVLVGDDEHGWGPKGTFNFEGGCYAKVIRLSAESEPDIFATTRRFGTILENVVFDPKTRMIDFNSEKITENTRASYPISYIAQASKIGIAGHPKNILMLTADAFGVLPPVSKLNIEQAMYHFISGYTAKLAGTEIGIKEPMAAFSTCFGAPFMPRPSSDYAALLGKRMEQHHSRAWLINTGWSGGSYGTGSRMSLTITRAILRAIFSGQLNDIQTEKEPFFNLEIPKMCPGVPETILNPRNTWKDKDVYDTTAKILAKKFVENFKKFNFPELTQYGPQEK